MRPNPRLFIETRARASNWLKPTQQIGRRSSGFPRKSRAGVLRVGFQFGLWSSVGKGAPPRAHSPPCSLSSLIQGQDDVVLQVRVIGAVGCKGGRHVGFVWFVTRTQDMVTPTWGCSSLAQTEPAPSVLQTNQKQPANLYQSFPSLLTTEAQGGQL